MSKPTPQDETRRALRATLGRYTTGVAIVTARGADGEPVGMTINSFSSVSLAPPLVAWCIDRGTASHAAFVGAAQFRITVLAEHQAELAMRFATRGADKFRDIETDGDEPPRVAGGCAWFRCERRRAIRLGDHTMLVGEVREFGERPAEPLVFAGGDFRQLRPVNAGADGHAARAA